MRQMKLLYGVLCTLCILCLPITTQALVLRGGIEETVSTPPEPGIVGMDIVVPKKGYPVIRQVFDDAPAWQAGLRQGDVIVKIDGQVSLDKTAREIDVAIPDVPGTPVTFTVHRQAGLYKTVTLIVAPLSRSTAHVQSRFSLTRVALNH
jgi:C-terminal processing protease CtpA/Prc